MVRVWDSPDGNGTSSEEAEGAHERGAVCGVQPRRDAHRHRRDGPDGAGVGFPDGNGTRRAERVRGACEEQTFTPDLLDSRKSSPGTTSRR